MQNVNFRNTIQCILQKNFRIRRIEEDDIKFFLCMGLLTWSYVRIFSRNYSRRRRENEFYLRKKYRLTSWLQLHRECYRQRQDYAFYRCPGCRQLVRVPRDKGKLRITCRRCGYSFEKKT